LGWKKNADAYKAEKAGGGKGKTQRSVEEKSLVGEIRGGRGSKFAKIEGEIGLENRKGVWPGRVRKKSQRGGSDGGQWETAKNWVATRGETEVATRENTKKNQPEKFS